MVKKARGTSGGVKLSDDLVERLAAEAERGYDVERLARQRRRGRRPLGSGAATVFQVRLDPELRKALQARADADETTPSEIVRRALRSHLGVGSPQRAARQDVRPRRRA